MAKKKRSSSSKNGQTTAKKKPLYKKWWFWIILIFVLGGIGSLGGKKETTDTTKKETNNSSAEVEEKKQQSSSKKSEPKKETKKEDKDMDLLNEFNNIQLGDIMSSGEGGVNIEDVKKTFGEPSSTSESNIEGQSVKLLTWAGLKGGSMLSGLSVSFSNDNAVSKSITGLKTKKGEKVTLEQFNNISTDGSFAKEQAIKDFGEPDGITTTLVNGSTTEILSWTKNVSGDVGANFNITFKDDNATSKANFSMK